jgi:hypothetical protein
MLQQGTNYTFAVKVVVKQGFALDFSSFASTLDSISNAIGHYSDLIDQSGNKELLLNEIDNITAGAYGCLSGKWYSRKTIYGTIDCTHINMCSITLLTQSMDEVKNNPAKDIYSVIKPLQDIMNYRVCVTRTPTTSRRLLLMPLTALQLGECVDNVDALKSALQALGQGGMASMLSSCSLAKTYCTQYPQVAASCPVTCGTCPTAPPGSPVTTAPTSMPTPDPNAWMKQGMHARMVVLTPVVPLRVLLSGGALQSVPLGTAMSLQANLEGGSAGATHMLNWTCTASSGCPASLNSFANATERSSKLSIPANTLTTAGEYVFAIQVSSSDGVKAQSSMRLKVLSGGLSVSISSSSELSGFDRMSTLRLCALVHPQNSAGSKSVGASFYSGLSYKWQISRATVAVPASHFTTGTDTMCVALRPGTLAAAAQYSVDLEVSSGGITGLATSMLSTVAMPAGSGSQSFKVTPADGSSRNSTFTLTAHGWSLDGFTTKYRFWYETSNGPVPLNELSLSSELHTKLPPGNLTIKALIQNVDVYGQLSSVITNTTVMVAGETVASVEDTSATASTFFKKSNALVNQDNLYGIVQEASQASAEIGSGVADENTTKYRTAFRTAVVDVITSSNFSDSMSADGADKLVTTLQSISAKPDEVETATGSKVFTLLESVTAKLPQSQANRIEQASGLNNAFVHTLSNVLEIPNGTGVDSVKQAHSLLDKMMTAEEKVRAACEPAVKLESRTLSTSAEKVARGSLYNKTFSHGKAKFVLPPSLESVIDSADKEASDVGVEIVQWSRSVRGVGNPPANDTNGSLGSDVSSLSIRSSSSGSKLPVKGLPESEPIEVDLSYDAVPGTQPMCVFYDYSSNSWSSEGCVLRQSTAGSAKCACTHLTDFAVWLSKVTTRAPVEAIVTNKTTAHPTNAPSAYPTLVPTNMTTSPPSLLPTPAPSPIPTLVPTTGVPTLAPTNQSTLSPTVAPTAQPTRHPSLAPTNKSTEHPSFVPTMVPSNASTAVPTVQPSPFPTFLPTLTQPPTQFNASLPPTLLPTHTPSEHPSWKPTAEPTADPTSDPTHAPSALPTLEPTGVPSMDPTADPTTQPSAHPSLAPTNQSLVPTLIPTKTITNTKHPTLAPTVSSTPHPTINPTANVTLVPTMAPTSGPLSSGMMLLTSVSDTNPNELVKATLKFRMKGSIESFSDNARRKLQEAIQTELDLPAGEKVALQVTAGSIIVTATIERAPAAKLLQLNQNVGSAKFDPLKDEFPIESLEISEIEQHRQSKWHDLYHRSRRGFAYLYLLMAAWASMCVIQTAVESKRTHAPSKQKQRIFDISDWMNMLVFIAVVARATVLLIDGFELMNTNTMSPFTIAMFFLASEICAYWCFTLLVFKWAVVVHSVRTGSTMLGHLKKYLIGVNVLQAAMLIIMWTLILTLQEHRKTLMIAGQMTLAIPTLLLSIAVMIYGARLVHQIKESSKRMSGVVKQDSAKQQAALKTLVMALLFGVLFLIKGGIMVVVAFLPQTSTPGVISGQQLTLEGVNSTVTVLAYSIVLFVFGDKLQWAHTAKDGIARGASFMFKRRSTTFSEVELKESRLEAQRRLVANAQVLHAKDSAVC